MTEPITPPDDSRTEPPRTPAVTDIEPVDGQPPADPAASPSAPTLETLQARLDEAERQRANLEQRLHDTRQHSDRQYAELQAADRMLAEVYGPHQQAQETANAVTFEAPEAPTQDAIIQDPSQAVTYAQSYAKSYGDYIHRRTIAEIAPFLQTVTQTAPVLGAVAEQSAASAISRARSQLAEEDRRAFDDHLPEIKKEIKKARHGQVLALDPRSYLMSHQMLGGRVQPVQSRPAAPVTAGVNRDTRQPSDTPPERIPAYFVKWATDAGRDPQEMWRRSRARRQRLS